MKNNKFYIDDLIRSVKENAHTMLVVDLKGNIRYCVGLKETPKNVPEINKLSEGRLLKGCSMSFIARDMEYDEKKAREIISSNVEALLYAKTHKLEPGVNIPQEELGKG